MAASPALSNIDLDGALPLAQAEADAWDATNALVAIMGAWIDEGGVLHEPADSPGWGFLYINGTGDKRINIAVYPDGTVDPSDEYDHQEGMPGTAISEYTNAHVVGWLETALQELPTPLGTGSVDLDIVLFAGYDEVSQSEDVVVCFYAEDDQNTEWAGLGLSWLQLLRSADAAVHLDAITGAVEATQFPEPVADYVFFASLAPGLNMISLPLKPITPYTARSFAQEIAATTVIKYDEASGRFVGFTPGAPDDGFAIEGGKGYIVNVPDGGMVAFIGAAWTNELPVNMAPPAISNSAWAFVVSGSVLDGDTMSASSGDYTAVVKNPRTGDVFTEAVDSGGYFATAWADLSRRTVVAAGDRVEVAVVDSSGKLVSGPFTHRVTLDEIRNATINTHLKLGVIIPAKSALLQNYPNPFNPETWIPYHLQDASPVSIRICNATGQLVRTLAIGYRDAGVYVSRSQAAHWDGKNEAGEEVANGLYFYTIQAGKYTASRKMTVTK